MVYYIFLMSSPIDARLYEITEAICERLRKKDFPSKKYWTSFDCRNVFLALKKLYRCFEYSGSPDPLVDVYNVYNEIAFEDFESIDDLIDYYSKVFHYRIPPEEKVLEKVYLSEEAKKLIEDIKSTYDYLYDLINELRRLGLKPEEIPETIARIESEIRRVEEAGKRLKGSEYLRLYRELNKVKSTLEKYKKMAEKYRKGYEELKKKIEERKAIPLIDAIKKMKGELWGYFYYLAYKKGEKRESRLRTLFRHVFDEILRRAERGEFRSIEDVKNFIRTEVDKLIIARGKPMPERREVPPIEISSVDEFRRWRSKFEDYFITAMIEAGYSPTSARRYLPMLRTKVFDIVELDLSTGMKYRWVDIEKMINDLVKEIVRTRPPPPTVTARRVTPTRALELYGMVGAEEREKLFKEFLDEVGITYEQYLAYHPVIKMQLESDFMRWLEKKFRGTE